MMEDTQTQSYFIRSCNVWYPDFETKIERREEAFQRESFHAMLALIRYFRSEITRQQFLSQFLADEAPEQSIYETKYSHIRSLCAAYQRKEISDAELDEQILVSFRAKPVDDVFSPPFALWDEVVCLISRLKKKMERLPIYFDGFCWVGYLLGNMPRQVFVEAVGDAASYLCRLQAYGFEYVKEALKETYSKEVSVALRLRKLCIDYKTGSISNDDFDHQVLELAREFCSDIPE